MEDLPEESYFTQLDKPATGFVDDPLGVSYFSSLNDTPDLPVQDPENPPVNSFTTNVNKTTAKAYVPTPDDLPGTSYFENIHAGEFGIAFVPDETQQNKVYEDIDPANNSYYVKNGITYLKHSQYGGVQVDSKMAPVIGTNGKPVVDPDHLKYGTGGTSKSPTPGESQTLLDNKKAPYVKDPYAPVSTYFEESVKSPAKNWARDLRADKVRTSAIYERRSTTFTGKLQGTLRDTLDDSSWVSNAFLVPSMNITDADDQYNRYWSSASLKFYDTTMGGNIACNARPQANWYADVRDPGRLDRNEASVNDYRGNFGLGVYYSEAIDDPAQKVFISFGVPQFNSISNFVRRAFDSDQIILTKTGREKSLWYTAAKTIVQLTYLVKAPILAASWFFMEAASKFFPGPQSKYYTLKPDMFHYWSVVDNLVNQLAINSGLVARLPWEDASSTSSQRPGRPYKMDSDHYDALHKHMPDIITKLKVGGAEITRIDVYAMASKAQRMYNKMFLNDYNHANSQGGATDYKGYVQKNNASHQTYITDAKGKTSIFARLGELVTSSYYSVDGADGKMNKTEMHPSLKEGGLQDDISLDKTDLNSSDPKLVTINNDKTQQIYTQATGGGTGFSATGETDQSGAGDPSEEDISKMELKESTQSSLDEDKAMDGHKTDSGWWDKIKGELSALYNDGTRFAVFSVDHTGSVSSSFSNSYGESDLSNKLNSTSSQIREARFSFADGNLLEGAGKVVQSVLGAAKDVALGALDGLTFGFSNILRGLAGNGYLDIPKHWMSSQAQLPRMTYNMSLISPYGNTISRLQNIYVPLCMILAGALPRATGRSSYGPPFICQVFDTGRFQSKLAAIESVSITVGTSNLPFNLSGKPLAIDVSFTVIDLSSILYMPVSAGGMLSNVNIAMDEDNTLVDYLAVLAGQDIYSQIYPFPKARLQLAKTLSSWSAVTSEAFQAALIHDKSLNGGGLFYLARPFAKTIEAVAKGTAATQTIDNR